MLLIIFVRKSKVTNAKNMVKDLPTVRWIRIVYKRLVYFIICQGWSSFVVNAMVYCMHSETLLVVANHQYRSPSFHQ